MNPRKDLQIVGEAAPGTNSPVGSEGVFEPLAVDAVWDGSQATADLIRPAQESRGPATRAGGHREARCKEASRHSDVGFPQRPRPPDGQL